MSLNLARYYNLVQATTMTHGQCSVKIPTNSLDLYTIPKNTHNYARLRWGFRLFFLDIYHLYVLTEEA